MRESLKPSSATTPILNLWPLLERCETLPPAVPAGMLWQNEHRKVVCHKYINSRPGCQRAKYTKTDMTRHSSSPVLPKCKVTPATTLKGFALLCQRCTAKHWHIPPLEIFWEHFHKQKKWTFSFQETACPEQNQSHWHCDQEVQALTTMPHCLPKK